MQVSTRLDKMDDVITSLQEWLGSQEDSISTSQQVMTDVKTKLETLRVKHRGVRRVTKELRKQVAVLVMSQERRISDFVDKRLQKVLPQLLHEYIANNFPHLTAGNTSAGQSSAGLDQNQEDAAPQHHGDADTQDDESSERSSNEQPEETADKSTEDPGQNPEDSSDVGDPHEVRSDEMEQREDSEHQEVNIPAGCTYFLINVLTAIILTW